MYVSRLLLVPISYVLVIYQTQTGKPRRWLGLKTAWIRPLISISVCRPAAVGWGCEPVRHQIHQTDPSGQSRRHLARSQCRTRLCRKIYHLSALWSSLLNYLPPNLHHFCTKPQHSCSFLNVPDGFVFGFYRVLPTWLHLSWKVWRKVFHLSRGLDLSAATTAARAHPSGETPQADRWHRLKFTPFLLGHLL